MSLRFSDKQKQVLSWWTRGSPHREKDAIVCDGAVRSGKTLCLGLSFLLWSMTRFRGQQFALCGKTTQSVRRNLLTSVIIYMGYSMIMSIIWITLESPDLAITEAAVGAGVTGAAVGSTGSSTIRRTVSASIFLPSPSRDTLARNA